MKRPRIWMLPSWYPTKDNPISGSFFKEQALCLSEDYDFCVLLMGRRDFSFRWKMLKEGFVSKTNLELVEQAPGYQEFTAYFGLPRFRYKVSWVLSRLGLNPAKNEAQYYQEWIRAVCDELTNRFGQSPDLVYAMTAQVNGDIGRVFSQVAGVPLVLAEHNPFPLVGTLLRPQVREAMESCNALIVVSHDKARQVLMQNIRCKPIVLGNLVDGFRFRPTAARVRERKNLLMVAAFNFYKDYETLFRVLVELRSLVTVAFRVTLVGYNPVSQVDDFNYGEKRFMDLLRSFGLEGSVELIPMVSRERMPEIYDEADAFLMTSIQEGLPVSSLEAAASGLPIFSTRCGGVEDFVDDSIGRLFAVQDYHAMALSLRDYLEGRITFDPGIIRAKVLALYGSEAFRARFRAIINPLLPPPSGNSAAGIIRLGSELASLEKEGMDGIDEA